MNTKIEVSIQVRAYTQETERVALRVETMVTTKMDIKNKFSPKLLLQNSKLNANADKSDFM